MALVKFNVPLWIDSDTSELEIVPTKGLEEWLKLNGITVKQIKLEQKHRPPYWHQPYAIQPRNPK